MTWDSEELVHRKMLITRTTRYLERFGFLLRGLENYYYPSILDWIDLIPEEAKHVIIIEFVTEEILQDLEAEGVSLPLNEDDLLYILDQELPSAE